MNEEKRKKNEECWNKESCEVMKRRVDGGGRRRRKVYIECIWEGEGRREQRPLLPTFPHYKSS